MQSLLCIYTAFWCWGSVRLCSTRILVRTEQTHLSLVMGEARQGSALHAGGRTPPMRSPSQLTSIPYGGRTPDNDPGLTPVQEPILERDHEATLTLLLAGVVDRRMSIINIQHGATPADSVGMPVAAWVLGECLLHWALRWRPAEVSLLILCLVKLITLWEDIYVCVSVCVCVCVCV